ncbi:hypothetical protein [Stenotrophomonas sp. GZD-301]|uniref:hypothetical protein n=1 Tax=Stenotrophomonas sp. GZD-301 TaxID=3404814 RepID=UPI003BB53828
MAEINNDTMSTTFSGFDRKNAVFGFVFLRLAVMRHSLPAAAVQRPGKPENPAGAGFFVRRLQAGISPAAGS